MNDTLYSLILDDYIEMEHTSFEESKYKLVNFFDFFIFRLFCTVLCHL